MLDSATMTKRILVLYAHPRHENSILNRALRAAIEDLPGVTLHDLYETYPDFFIDVTREQKLLLEHDIVVFQHPVYWYSAPAIVKEWQDVVLEYGWAYGPGGDRLAGKHFMQALTTGSNADFYARDGVHNFTLDEFLRPFEQTARFCRMVCLAPFVVHGTEDLEGQAARYRAVLVAIANGEMPECSPAIPAPG